MPPTDGRAQRPCTSCDQKYSVRVTKFRVFSIFLTFDPDARPNAAPDRRDTTHLGGTPDAQHNRTAQTGLRRAVLKIQSFVRFLGGVWSGFVLPLLMQGGPSWGGPEIFIFTEILIFGRGGGPSAHEER